MRPSPATLSVSTDSALARETTGARLADFKELAKPGIAGFVVVMAVASYLLAADGAVDWLTLGGLMLGTALTAGGAGALNHVAERDADALMERTAARPLPTGRLSPTVATVYALGIVTAGAAILAVATNPVTTGLAVLTVGLYVLVYTPMKRRSVHNTLVGAVPGALPALGGAAAASGFVDATGLALFAILYLWQLPHFFALAWLLRDDYQRGGFRMLPSAVTGRLWTTRLVLGATLLLLVAGMVPSMLGATGLLYLVGMAGLGTAFTIPAFSFYSGPTETRARRLFVSSVVYVPAFFALVVLDLLVG